MKEIHHLAELTKTSEIGIIGTKRDGFVLSS